MPRSFRISLLILLIAFGGGIAFQKWVSVGRVMEFASKPAVTKALEIEPELRDSTTFCVLAMGQSNAANHGSVPGRAGAGVFVLHDGRIFEAIDPIPGASGKGGSVWTRFAPAWLRRPDVEHVLVNCVAQSSSSLDSWLPGSANFLRVQRAVVDFTDRGLAIDAVVWHQGETEAWHNDAKGAEYALKIESLMDGLRGVGIKAPVFVCLASRDGEGVINPAIRLAQASIWNASGNVFAGVDADSLGDEFRSDGVHFNNRGLERFAELLEEAMDHRSDRAATIDPP